MRGSQRHLGLLLQLAVFAGFLVLPGCATQINSPTQPVLISSEPLGAEVIVDDRFYLTTPAKVRLSRLSPHVAHVQRDGYQPARIEITRGMSKWALLDFFCLVFLPKCVSEDLKEGGFYRFDDEVEVTLTRTALSQSLPPPTPR